jgi:hypothetical protein
MLRKRHTINLAPVAAEYTAISRVWRIISLVNNKIVHATHFATNIIPISITKN